MTEKNEYKVIQEPGRSPRTTRPGNWLHAFYSEDGIYYGSMDLGKLPEMTGVKKRISGSNVEFGRND